MADKHKRDPSWQTDLIWHYFHEVTTEAKPWGDWYKDMDPFGELRNRHRIYELLVDNADQTNPSTQDLVGKSKIPWNQNNAGFLKTIGGKLFCGSLIKIVFTRYMGWSGVEPHSNDVDKKGFDAASWTIDNLRRKKPVRAGLGGHHYVGIVGHRCRTIPLPPGIAGPLQCTVENEFLCLEPWAGGVLATDSITYAGTVTGFLGIIQQGGSTWKYGTLNVSLVEA